VEYDSKEDKEPEGPLAKSIIPAYRAVAGSKIDVSMDSQGRISDLKLPQKLIDAAKNLPPGAAPPGGMLSQDGLKQIMDLSGLLLPKEPVRKGSTWNQKLEMKSPGGNLAVEKINTYQGSAKRDGKDLERIALKMTFTIDSEIVKIKSQEAEGSAYFDNAAGRIVESVMTQNQEMEANIKGQTQAE